MEIYAATTGPERVEKIADAGLRLSQYKGGVTGYVTHIREIGNTLYVCGTSGQVYRRTPEGEWLHCDQGIFQPATRKEMLDDDDDDLDGDDDDDDDLDSEAMPPFNVLNCIDGNHERDIYVVGNLGLAFHFNEIEWRRLRLPTDENLLWVRCYGPDEVYICGDNGILLRGNAQKGFREVSGVEDNHTWCCLAKFRDKVYLSAMEGLFAWDGKKIARVKTGLKPEPETWQVDASPIGEALWSFGTRDLVWFDGNTWQRLHHPDNPKIGE